MDFCYVKLILTQPCKLLNIITCKKKKDRVYCVYTYIIHDITKKKKNIYI